MSRLNRGSIFIERDEKEDEISKSKIDRFIFLVFLVALTLIPIVIGAKAILFVSPLISGTGVTGTGYQLDFFTYFKFVILVMLTIVAFLLFLYKLYFLNYKVKWNFVSWSIIVFLFALVLSAFFAEHKSIALWGIYNRHDGAITFICYAILMFIALNITYPQNALKKLVYTLYPFVWINVIISLLNLYGVNILQKSFFQKIFTLFLIDDMTINETSVLTGTLNQWNYMSGYSAVMAIVFLTLAVFHGSVKSKLVNLFTAIAAFLTILASISTSGFITLLFMSLLVLVLIFIKANKKQSLIWFASFIIFAIISTGVLSKHNPQVWTESVGFFTNTNPFVQEESFSGLYFPVNKVGATDSKLELPTLTERYWSAGSGRIYIWENTISLIMEKPLTGYGLDTLTYHFPQNDINKRSGMYYENILIDKPHNLYLSILYGTGLLGLLSFMSFISIYTCRLVKYVIKDTNLPVIWAFTLGFGAFLLQALLNDSVIGGSIVPFLATSIILVISNSKVEEEIL